MNKYLTTVKLGGSTIKTVVFADSSIHARLLLQYQFGMNCIVSNPTLTTESPTHYESLDRIVKAVEPTSHSLVTKPPKPSKIASLKPKTPDQMRIAQLKANVDRQRDALRRERDNQHRRKDAERHIHRFGKI